MLSNSPSLPRSRNRPRGSSSFYKDLHTPLAFVSPSRILPSPTTWTAGQWRWDSCRGAKVESQRLHLDLHNSVPVTCSAELYSDLRQPSLILITGQLKVKQTNMYWWEIMANLWLGNQAILIRQPRDIATLVTGPPGAPKSGHEKWIVARTSCNPTIARVFSSEGSPFPYILAFLGVCTQGKNNNIGYCSPTRLVRYISSSRIFRGMETWHWATKRNAELWNVEHRGQRLSLYSVEFGGNVWHIWSSMAGWHMYGHLLPPLQHDHDRSWCTQYRHTTRQGLHSLLEPSPIVSSLWHLGLLILKLVFVLWWIPLLFPRERHGGGLNTLWISINMYYIILCRILQVLHCSPLQSQQLVPRTFAHGQIEKALEYLTPIIPTKICMYIYLKVPISRILVQLYPPCPITINSTNRLTAPKKKGIGR